VARSTVSVRDLISSAFEQVAPRERRKMEYNESLKERYQHLREISRITKYVAAAGGCLRVCRGLLL
jgi:hypothetical protein